MREIPRQRVLSVNFTKETVKQETEQFFERVCQGSLRLMVNFFLAARRLRKKIWMSYIVC